MSLIQDCNKRATSAWLLSLTVLDTDLKGHVFEIINALQSQLCIFVSLYHLQMSKSEWEAEWSTVF